MYTGCGRESGKGECRCNSGGLSNFDIIWRGRSNMVVMR